MDVLRTIGGLEGILSPSPWNRPLARETHGMVVYRFGYRFDMLDFDPSTGELVKDGFRVRLRPQPARALEHLLVRHGRLVSRAELQQAIWTQDTFVHFDHGLNSCMKQIRAAIGDQRAAPRYIETLVKRGFRFIAPVTMLTLD